MLNRAHAGTFDKISPKHLDRNVTEFAERRNVRERDTLNQMGELARGMMGKRLKYSDLIFN